jgi:hypothetical protein
VERCTFSFLSIVSAALRVLLRFVVGSVGLPICNACSTSRFCWTSSLEPPSPSPSYAAPSLKSRVSHFVATILPYTMLMMRSCICYLWWWRGVAWRDLAWCDVQCPPCARLPPPQPPRGSGLPPAAAVLAPRPFPGRVLRCAPCSGQCACVCAGVHGVEEHGEDPAGAGEEQGRGLLLQEHQQ